MTSSTAVGRPLIVGLGEALFDRIGGEAILGGAPVNFAVHAHQMLRGRGGRAVVASRIGCDELGERLLAELAGRGLDNAWIQRDEAAPTGVVEVTLDASGQPTYDISTGVAWDRFEFTRAWADLAKRAAAVCFGTLAQRTTESRQAIRQFLAACPQALRVCDLNLRQQYFDREVVEASLRAAGVLKLNEEELPVVCELLGAPHSGRSATVDAAVGWLMDAFGLDAVAYTRGAQGTVLYHRGARLDEEPKLSPPQPGADSVGAGDACCAALVAGMLIGLEPQQILRLANEAGAFVASQRGATPRLPDELTAAFPG
jgi:fructokinase